MNDRMTAYLSNNARTSTSTSGTISEIAAEWALCNTERPHQTQTTGTNHDGLSSIATSCTSLLVSIRVGSEPS